MGFEIIDVRHNDATCQYEYVVVEVRGDKDGTKNNG